MTHAQRIVILHKHYLPDPEIQAILLGRIVESLSKNHEIRVVCGQYSMEDAAGARRGVHRIFQFNETRSQLGVRAVNLVAYCFGAMAWMVRNRGTFDVVIVLSTPPVLWPCLVRLVSRAVTSKMIYYNVDIHPEGLRSGLVLGGGFVYHALQGIDRWTCNAADALVVISEDMRQLMVERGCDSARIIREPLIGVDDTDQARVEASTSRITELVYCGNVGKFQRLESVIRHVVTLADAGRDISLLVVGDGSERLRLEEYVRASGSGAVKFVGRVNRERAREYELAAGACVVSLAPGVVKSSFPAKYVGYLHAERPILALVDTDSFLARELESAGVGAVAPPDGLLSRFEEAIDQLERLPADLGLRAQRLFKEKYVTSASLEAWTALLDEMNTDTGAAT